MHGRKKPWGGAQLASFDNRSSFVVDDVVMQPVKGICDLLPVPRRLPVQDSRNENSCAYRGESALAATRSPLSRKKSTLQMMYDLTTGRSRFDACRISNEEGC